MPDPDIGGRRRVCSPADVTPGSPEVVTVDGTDIAVIAHEGDFFAVENTCPHQGGPVGTGKVEDGCVYCPWHGWQFDLETGAHVHGTERAVTYDVDVEGEDLFVLV